MNVKRTIFLSAGSIVAVMLMASSAMAAATPAATKPAAGGTAGGAADAGGDGHKAGVGIVGLKSKSNATDDPLQATDVSKVKAGGVGVTKSGKKVTATGSADANAHAYVNADGNPAADSSSNAAAGAKAGKKTGAGANIPKGSATASAVGGGGPKGGAGKPTATATAKLGAEKSVATAVAGGKTVSTNGSTGKTIITHPKPNETVAVTFTAHTEAVAISLPGKAEAYSKVALGNQTFYGPKVLAAAQAAAFAYAEAGINYANAYSNSGSDAYATRGSADAFADTYAYASAYVFHDGVAIITKVIGDPNAGHMYREYCSWRLDDQRYICHELPKGTSIPVDVQCASLPMERMPPDLKKLCQKVPLPIVDIRPLHK